MMQKYTFFLRKEVFSKGFLTPETQQENGVRKSQDLF